MVRRFMTADQGAEQVSELKLATVGWTAFVLQRARELLIRGFQPDRCGVHFSWIPNCESAAAEKAV